ncbi:GNAT family N-acetyltransferase [Erythrobacter sp. WG]|uniref:GNAT family N-acetyltransferase n=1 Tax=Erythrobacter sp. WG TaxID=2985510 RepID=UPI00226D9C89|nr:GNAT family N-acetyltransferase [Erythrobacter sp. WG]MCX9146048.1 GNAT family N-acetyltransferase [Erythrobacter sp. WG]
MRPTGARDWSLRLARAEDAGAMAALVGAGSRGTADYARLIRKGRSLVAHGGETLAGLLVAEPFSRELHIWELAVAAEHRSRGVGSGLVRAAQIDGRNMGTRALTLTTDRHDGAAFYTRLGFEEVTALDAHPRLAGELANEVDDGLPADRRCAMICFLD